MRSQGSHLAALSLLFCLLGPAVAISVGAAASAPRAVTSDVRGAIAKADPDPVALERLCRDEVKRLGEALKVCDRQLDQQRYQHEAAVRSITQRRGMAQKNVQELQKEVKEGEEELERINAINAELHDELMGELERFKGTSNFSTLGLAVATSTLPPAEKNSMNAVDAWLRCEDLKTNMQLDVNQCMAKLRAEEGRQEMRQDNHEQLARSAQDSEGILQERLDLLRQQLAQARERTERLRQQIQQAKGASNVALAQDPQQQGEELAVVASAQEAAPHSQERGNDEPGIGTASAQKALQEAAKASAAAQMSHRKAQEASRRLAKQAERSSAEVEASREKARLLGRDVAQQNETLAQQRREAQRAKRKAVETEERAGELQMELGRLSDASREAFKKAFLLDHDRSRAKSAYEDALVEARSASELWEGAQKEENAARFELSRLEARRTRAEWDLSAAARVEAAAAKRAEEARAHLRDAEARLAAELAAESKLKAALGQPGQKPVPSGSASVPHLWGLNLPLAVVLIVVYPVVGI